MTAMHLMAQYLLIGDHAVHTINGLVSYSNGTNEFKIPHSNYRADVAGLKADGNNFVIEIFVTHLLETSKISFLKENMIHSIEIDISNVDPNIGNDALLKILLEDVSRQKVLYSPISQSIIIETQEVKIEVKPWYDDLIPLGIIVGIGAAIYTLLTGRKTKHKRR
jgi:hypothetical protein